MRHAGAGAQQEAPPPARAPRTFRFFHPRSGAETHLLLPPATCVAYTRILFFNTIFRAPHDGPVRTLGHALVLYLGHARHPSLCDPRRGHRAVHEKREPLLSASAAPKVRRSMTILTLYPLPGRISFEAHRRACSERRTLRPDRPPSRAYLESIREPLPRLPVAEEPIRNPYA